MTKGGPAPEPEAAEPNGADRRRHGRLRTDLAGEIVTALGPVMDLSRSGMRIASPSKPPLHVGLKCSLEVRCADVQVLLPVEIMRVRQGRRGQWDIGLQFRELDDRQARALGMLARMAVNTADPTRPSK
ncbi:MAG: PilZ domain-containing protein [Planctomycetota bacterium]